MKSGMRLIVGMTEMMVSGDCYLLRVLGVAAWHGPLHTYDHPPRVDTRSQPPHMPRIASLEVVL